MNKNILFAFVVALASAQVYAQENKQEPKIVVKAESKGVMAQAKDKFATAKNTLDTAVTDAITKVKSTTRADIKNFVTDKRFVAAVAVVAAGYATYKAVTQCNWVREKLGLEPVVKAKSCDACYIS